MESNNNSRYNPSTPNATVDEHILDYLNDGLTPAQQHELELQMLDDPFAEDALEGLAQFHNKKDIQVFVKELNDNLQKQTEAKRARKNKRKFVLDKWIIVTAVMILFLCIIGYLVLHILLKTNHPH